METAGNKRLIDFIVDYIPWFSTMLACFVSSTGFYDPQFPQLRDANNNIISNYLGVEYRCAEFTLDRFEITQSNKGIIECVFRIDKSKSIVESMFFDGDEPDMILEYGYSPLNKSDSIQNTVHIWHNLNYSISLRDSLTSCKVSITKRARK